MMIFFSPCVRHPQNDNDDDDDDDDDEDDDGDDDDDDDDDDDVYFTLCVSSSFLDHRLRCSSTRLTTDNKG